MSVEKLLPQNVEAEAAVLGSILIDPEAIMQVADYLRPDDFLAMFRYVRGEAYQKGSFRDFLKSAGG